MRMRICPHTIGVRVFCAIRIVGILVNHLLKSASQNDFEQNVRISEAASEKIFRVSFAG